MERGAFSSNLYIGAHTTVFSDQLRLIDGISSMCLFGKSELDKKIYFMKEVSLMKKIIMLCFGWMFFGIGVVGVIVPVLPTTPFLLLAAALFARSSERCELLLKNSKVYERYVVPFKQDGGITRKKKCEILFIVYAVMFISGLLVSHLYIRILLIVVVLVLSYFILRIPIARNEIK